MQVRSSVIDFIFNIEFQKAEDFFNDKAKQSLENKMSLGIVSVIRALISRSESDFKSAFSRLNETKESASNRFLELTTKLFPSAGAFTIKGLQLIDDPRFTSDADDQSEFVKRYHKRSAAELIVAECTLLKIFLNCIFTSEQENIFSSIFSNKEVPTFRSAFMSLYHANDRFGQLPEGHVLTSDQEYRNGLKLTWGLCSLLSWLLPNPLTVILGTSSFQPSTITDTLNIIESAASSSGLHSILAKLVLIMYYSDLKTNFSQLKSSLDSLGRPKSALHRYFQAKLSRLEGQPAVAIELLTKIPLSPHMIQLPIYWEIIQNLAESQKWPEAIQFIKFLRECSPDGFPSKIFSYYLEAAFMQASTGRAFSAPSMEVRCVLKKVLEAARSEHKEPRPLLDRLALTRARNVLNGNEYFFLPHFEILLLWNRLKDISYKDFVMVHVRKALESSEQLTFEQQSLGWLILAILTDDPKSSANLINNHIIPRERTLGSPNFVSIRAKCKLVESYLLEGKKEAANLLLNQIEMKCFGKNGFPGQITILLLISKLKQESI